MHIKIIAGIGYDSMGDCLTDTKVTTAIDDTLSRLSDEFGGATLTFGKGAWIDDGGKLVKEDCVIFESYTERTMPHTLASVTEISLAANTIAQLLRIDLRQTSVVLAIDGKHEFITA